MTDWKVGDLAVCVDAGPVRDVCGNGGRETNPKYVANLVEGRVYEITQIVSCNCGGGHVGLGSHKDRAGGSADRFRKVQHDKPEACETAFTVLLNRSKRKVGA